MQSPQPYKKSYPAGLLAERWIDAGYAVLILDPEGDHVGLTRRPGVHLADAAAHLPAPTDLLAIARTGRASLVLDLSGLPEASKSAYLNRLPDAVAAEADGPKPALLRSRTALVSRGGRCLAG